jgi:glycerol-3-phosphate dehydrogenase
MLCRVLNVNATATTAQVPLPGGSTAAPRDSAQWPHLYDLYGSRAGQVAALAVSRPDLARPLSPLYPDIAAQVVFSARHEFCATVADFIRRRSLLGASRDQGWSAAPAVASLLAAEFAWSAQRQEQEIEAYGRDIRKTESFRAAGDRDARELAHSG